MTRKSVPPEASPPSALFVLVYVSTGQTWEYGDAKTMWHPSLEFADLLELVARGTSSI